MSKHYKKLIVLLILLLAVAFFLSLAFASAKDELCEQCQLCQNKALVKEAILAYDGDSSDPNLLEFYDPNVGVVVVGDWDEDIVWWETGDVFGLVQKTGGEYRLQIFAEGDRVFVRISWHPGFPNNPLSKAQVVDYQISNGKIVCVWIHPPGEFCAFGASDYPFWE